LYQCLCFFKLDIQEVSKIAKYKNDFLLTIFAYVGHYIFAIGLKTHPVTFVKRNWTKICSEPVFVRFLSFSKLKWMHIFENKWPLKYVNIISKLKDHFSIDFLLFSNRFRDSIIRSGRSEKNRRFIDFFRSISDRLTPLLLNFNQIDGSWQSNYDMVSMQFKSNRLLLFFWLY
jgi:hypothetical protein